MPICNFKDDYLALGKLFRLESSDVFGLDRTFCLKMRFDCEVHIFNDGLFFHLIFYYFIILTDFELFELNLKFDFIADQFNSNAII